MNKPNCNGRINIIEPDLKTKFAMMDRNPIDSKNSFGDALTGIWQNSQLSEVFFSAANMKLLQNEMKVGVYNLSNKQFVICEQNYDNLKIIMRSIFLEKSKNQPNNITEQISELNQCVLDFAVPQIYNQLISYHKYQRDISTIQAPLPLPQLSKAPKQLTMKKNLF